MLLSDKLAKVLPPPDIERASYLIEDLRNSVPSGEISTVLDMGAGSGSMSAACLDVFPEAKITLVDLAARLTLSDFLEESKVAQCVGLDWPATQELSGITFDLVLSMDVLEHVPDWRDALSGLFPHVRPGGYLYIQAPSRYPSPNWPGKAIRMNRLKGFLGKHNPANHVRHGLSCKEILDVCSQSFTPLVAAESYVVDGVCHCAFKPRTHLLLQKTS